MSDDVGSIASGFINNFAYGTLILGSNTYVELVDQAHNSTGTGAEAVYANSLVVPAGTTLNLNGLNLYVRDLQVSGTVVGGTITQLANAGALPVGSPTPGMLSTAGELDHWTFFAQRGQTLTVALDPGSGAAGGPIAPQLDWGQVQLLDPSGKVLATAAGATSGALLTLSNVALTSSGVYTVAVNAPAGHTASTGNYVLTAWNVTPVVQSLSLNQRITSTIPTPYAVNEWTFSATANTQVQLNVLAESAVGLSFTLTGPNGFSGFSNLSGSSGLFTLPSAGAYTLTVEGTGGATGSVAFEMAQTSQTALASGVPYSGTLAGSGQAELFVINLPTTAQLQVDLTDPNSADENEVYLSHGSPPTRADYQYRYPAAGADQEVLAPSAEPGNWYVLVYADSVVTPGTFALTATADTVVLSGATPAKGGTSATTTMTLTGAGFTNGTQVALVGQDGTPYSSTTLNVDSPTQITVTFAAGAIPAGAYTIRVTQPNGDTAQLPGAFTMVQGGQAVLTTNVIVPNPIGNHIASVIYVQYSNTGDVAMPAPILDLSASRPNNSGPGTVSGAIMTLNGSLQTSGFWTTAYPAGFSSSVQILASGATPGILQPGESEEVPVYYDGWIQSQWNFSDTSINFNLGVLDATNTSAVPWSTLETSLQPSSISTAAWDALFPNLEAQVGPTWGDYVQQLDANAQYLGELGESVTDVGQLFSFEVQQADGLSALTQLTSATDAQVTTPGLALSFSRSFGPSIIDRNQSGPFGWGWSDSWQTSLTTEADGTVVVTGPGGSQREFQPDSRGGYFAQPGDYGTLAAVSGGGYTLTEQDGQVTAFNPDGTLDYVQDTDGNRITAGHTNGNLTSLTASSGQPLTLAYNAAGLITSITDSDGRTTTYTYDPTNQYLLSVTDFNGETTTYTYDTTDTGAAAHELLSIGNPDSTTQYFTYDAQGRETDTHLTNNAEDTTFAYALGQVSITDALHDTTKDEFDARGLLVTVVNPLGNATHYTYDSHLNLTQTTDAAGQIWTNTYDVNGNLAASTDANGNTVKYTYSAADDRLASVTDANGNTTKYAYDGSGNLSSTTYADGTVESLAYDPVGNVISSTDRAGQATHSTYDSFGDVLTETFADGSETTYAYDSHQNLLTATDADGTTTLTYNSADLLTKILYPSGRYLLFSYDSAGRRIQLQDPQDSYTVNYAYDTAGRLETLTDGSGNLIAKYTYDAAGRLSRQDNGNGTYTTYTYDAAGDILQLMNHAPNGTVNSSFVYTYDSLGNRTTETTIDGEWTYTYDPTGQLTLAVFQPNATDPDGIAAQRLQYVYDPAGNRTETILNGVMTPYTTNDLNEYTQVGGTTHEYDANGNMISQSDSTGTTTYTYNDRNQLIGVSGPGGTYTYQHDVLGNLAATTANGQTTRYLIDPTGLGNVISTYTGAGSLIANYTYGLGLISRVDSTGFHGYYNYDATGSSVGISNDFGIYINTYTYQPFGVELTEAVQVANPFQFAGQTGVISSGNSLNLMRSRSYSTISGRFISTDPIGVLGGFNIYTYTKNSPIDLSDPSGLLPIPSLTQLEHAQQTYDGYENIQTAIDLGHAAGTLNLEEASKVTGGIIGGEAGTDAGAAIGTVLGTDIGLAIGVVTANPVIAFVAAEYLGGALGILGGVAGGYLGTKVGEYLGGVYGRTLDKLLTPTPPNQSVSAAMCFAVSSHDPNDIYGPAGYGSAGYVLDSGYYPYRIDFQNSATATAPAQQVVITDQLDSNLDWTSFRWTAFGFGDTNITVPTGTLHYETTVPAADNGENFVVDVVLDFNPTTGLLTVTFQSLDPNTQLPPDVLTGFLPPFNANTGSGQGFVSYLVKPKAGLATGTTITDVAVITFDGNTPIATDQVDDNDASKGVSTTKQALVTIDSGTPTSSVTALPATEPTSFALNWSGQDDPNGSGIADYSVYVSTNGGAYAPFLTDTTQISATFTGTPGDTYNFYSVATDNVGNAQPTPTAAQATTQILPSSAPTVAAWVESLQYTDPTSAAYGAIRQAQGNGDTDASTGDPIYEVDPYFANLGVSGLLQSGSSGAVQTAALWIQWYLGHLNGAADPNGAGSIDNYWYTAAGAAGTPATYPGSVSPDSVDSYAGTFLQMVGKYVAAGGSLSILKAAGVQQQLESIAGAILALQDSDGLTWANPTKQAKYLANNSEAFAGLQAMAQIESVVYGNTAGASTYSQAAARIQNGIETQLVDSNGLFRIAKFSDRTFSDFDTTNWDDSALIVWPALFGVISPSSAQAQLQIQALDKNWSWATTLVDPTNYTWPSVGYAALIGNDATQGTTHTNWVVGQAFPSGATQPSGPFTVADGGWLLDALATTSGDYPASAVTALPTWETSTSFTVSWAGQVAAGGAAVASYDVLVSDDGGPWAPFQSDTTQTSATFTGQDGHTYAFSSVATDALGNVQPTSGTQATTTVDATPPASAVTALPAYSHSATIALSWSGSDGASASGVASYTVYVSDDGGAFTPLLTGTTLTSTTFTGQNGHTYGFYSVATDAAGNVQPTPTAAQATTTVSVPVSPPPVSPPPPPPPPASPAQVGYPQFAVGADAGGPSAVTVYNQAGGVVTTLNPFPSTTGGVRTAVADFLGNGTDEVAVGTGPGTTAEVKIIDPSTGAVLFDVQPFGSFTGGVFVAAGDVTGDGKADLVITPDLSGGPRVEVYEGGDFREVANFFGIDDPNFRGGARAAVGDLNGDGFSDLVISAGFGGGPRVSVYDGKALTQGQEVHLVPDFFLFEPALRNGAYVAVGDVDGDGFADIIGGGGPGGGPRVLVVSGKTLLTQGAVAALGAPVANFFAGDVNNRGGIRVTAKNLDGDAHADVVVGDGTGAGSTVTAYLGKNLAAGDDTADLSFDAFAGSAAGVYVG